ncbi:MAG: methyltransferase domain-containing protein, partial [Planctomycetota bacterium]
MDPVERVREEFDRAEVAARLGRLGDETELWDIERRALDGRLAPGALVLDVGCGEGREAVALLRRGCRVVAGDLSQGMLDRARPVVGGKARPDRPAGWLCRPASWLCQFDARTLPFRPGAFDAVVLTNMLLQYVWPRAARVEAAREVRRVLAPGGFACFQISIWPLAEDLLGCRAPAPVRRGLRLLIGLTVLAVNLLTDILRAVFRTRLQPGDRWTGRGV